MRSRRRTPYLLLTLLATAVALPVSAQTPSDISEVVLFASQSIDVDKSVEAGLASVVAGDVVVNEAGGSLYVDKDVTIGGDVAASSIVLKRNVVVEGSASFDILNSSGTILGPELSPLATPVLALPPFIPAVVRAGAADVDVATGSSLTLGGGEYGDVTIGDGATVTLSGGLYDVRSIAAGDNARLLFDAATDLRIEDGISWGEFGQMRPSDGAAVTAVDVIAYVGGSDGPTEAAYFAQDMTLEANVYAPNGTIKFKKNAAVDGALLADRLEIDKDSQFVLASFFGNKAPTADPQTVATGGALSLEITLTGSDPEGEDLAFSITDGPDAGTLSTISPIVPPAVQRCSLSANACTVDPDCPAGETCDSIQPPTTSATVTYFPTDPGAEAEDEFEFTVTDPEGLSGSAVVTINPNDPSPPPPGLDEVVAEDVSADTTNETPISIGLVAGGPEAETLTFSVISLPSGGSLATTGGSAITTVPFDLAEAQVVYTPSVGTTSDGFDFSARTSGASCTAASPPTCDTASVAVDVGALFELAPQRTVRAPIDTPVQVTLEAQPGGSGTSIPQRPQTASRDRSTTRSSTPTRSRPVRSGPVTLQAQSAIDATVAWNVADADTNGFGDENNSTFPGWPGTPALVSAGVGGTGGDGSNGTRRIHMEFDIANLTGTVVSSATVDLATSLGGTDSLDTFFFTGTADGNGTLENSDFESSATQLSGVVMPVSSAGSFSFDVSSELQAAIDAGFDYFVVQGRVDEQLAGSARGLQVRSACATCGGADPPTLNVSTGEPNLVVTEFGAPAAASLDEPIGASVTLEIANVGTADIPPGASASIGFYISTDSQITTNDRLLSGGRESFQQQVPNGLAVGETATITLFSGANVSSTFPDANPPSGDVFIGVLVDEFDLIAESNEADNTDALPIAIGSQPAPSLVWQISALPPPSESTFSFNGQPVSVGQTFNTTPTLLLTPAPGFVGTTTIEYTVTENQVTIDAGLIDIVFEALLNCQADKLDCNQGRGVALSRPSARAQLPPDSPQLSLGVVGKGDVTARLLGVEKGSMPASCGGSRCAAAFPRNAQVIVNARSLEYDSEFVGWRGDCGGRGPVAVVDMSGAKECVAIFRTTSSGGGR